MNWYAVSTKPGQEDLATQNLIRVNMETFCPKIKQNKVIRRKRQVVIHPLFPGYFFARFNIETDFRTVNYAHGVRRVVKFGSVPAKVDEETIQSIQSRLQDGYVTIQPSTFTPGQTVRILEGPLKGLEAVFEREMTDQQRVVLLLQSLSFQARVVLDLEYVENL